MDLDEIAVNYYHDSLGLAQKALISGITVSGVAYFVAISGESKAPYIIPFLEIEVSSLRFFSISLLILYFACGMLCLYGVQKSIDNWKLISKEELSLRLLHVPSILLVGTISRACLYGGLFMVGASLSSQILEIEGWKNSLVGSLLASPYFVAFRCSSDLKDNAKSKSLAT
jgi:hypothetical protein